jgi:hypothetical protein
VNPNDQITIRDKENLRASLAMQHANLGYPLRSIASIEAVVREMMTEFGEAPAVVPLQPEASGSQVKSYSVHPHEEEGKWYLSDGVESEYLPLAGGAAWSLYSDPEEGRMYAATGVPEDTVWCDEVLVVKQELVGVKINSDKTFNVQGTTATMITRWQGLCKHLFLHIIITTPSSFCFEVLPNIVYDRQTTINNNSNYLTTTSNNNAFCFENLLFEGAAFAATTTTAVASGFKQLMCRVRASHSTRHVSCTSQSCTLSSPTSEAQELSSSTSKQAVIAASSTT